ncbi:hypothetical protein KW791_01350 [Candidatus Parcubacteria bacterium]|nr:hypothetical protein [Candidatus Parcubacteria bacterium]
MRTYVFTSLILGFIFLSASTSLAASVIKKSVPKTPMLYAWLSRPESRSASISSEQILNIQIENSGQGINTLLDIEILDSQNKRVFQQPIDNVMLPKNGIKTLTIGVPSNLPSGSYHFAGGVFGPHWKNLIRWYYDMPKFNVGK